MKNNRDKRKWTNLLIVMLSCLVIVSSSNLMIVSAVSVSEEGHGGVTLAEQLEINRVLKLIESNYYHKIDRQKILEGAINGMLEALDDPYSSYIFGDKVEKFDENRTGEFFGIGVEVMIKDNRVVIASVIKGAPAEKAGVKAQDEIVDVNSEVIKGMDLNAVGKKIKGERGSKVTLRLKREGVADLINVTIVRDKIEQVTVKSKMIEGTMGYIDILQFKENTALQFKEALVQLQQQHMKGLIIDVRGNPGGILDVVVDIAEVFIPHAKVIAKMQDDKNHLEIITSSAKTVVSYPIVVLIDKNSASGSEMLAGALQDHGLATIIGEVSFGKGTAQQIFEHEKTNSILKLTTSKWLTPNGYWVNENKIKPDIAVEQAEIYNMTDFTSEVTLQFDQVDEDVKKAQIILKALGYPVKRQDGYFDESTVTALKQFQSKFRIANTGNLDKETVNYLRTSIKEHFESGKSDLQLAKAIEQMRKEILRISSKL